MINDRLKYFTVLWALVIYLEHIRNPQLALHGLGQLNLAAVVLCLWVPGSWFWLTGLAVVNDFNIWFWFDKARSNVLFLEFFINSCIVFIFLYLSISNSWIKRKQEDFYTILAPLLRVVLVIIYIFCFLAKLNIDFLNPNVSCAAVFIDAWSIYFKNHIPGAEGLKQLAIWGTIIIEGGIPVLLIIPRLRFWAILLGGALHFTIALWPARIFFSFSTFMLVLCLFFLSDKAFKRIQLWTNRISNVVKDFLPSKALRWVLVASFIAGTSYVNIHYVRDLHFWIVPWSLFYLTLWMFFLCASWQCPEHSTKRYFMTNPSWMMLLVVPFVINGLCPYLGIKSGRSLTMYSNLRVGYKPNHLFIPPAWTIAKHDFVRILASNDPVFMDYINKRDLLVDVEFRRLVEQASKDFFVRCLYRGKIIDLSKQTGLPSNLPLLKPLSWWEKKVLTFKTVDTSDHCGCQL